jgi:hypothetical protein
MSSPYSRFRLEPLEFLYFTAFKVPSARKAAILGCCRLFKAAVVYHEVSVRRFSALEPTLLLWEQGLLVCAPP